MPTHATPQRRETDVYALILTAYRCAMAETSVDGADGREAGWNALEAVSPPGEAGALFGHFYGFVRALLACAECPLSCHPLSSADLCRDVRLAMRMIEAAQRADVTDLLDAASTLLRVDELGDALHATQALAGALSRRGLFLCAKRDGEPCRSDLCPHRRLH
jgi:hypothetical protein